jgi:hypothetical protein
LDYSNPCTLEMPLIYNEHSHRPKYYAYCHTHTQYPLHHTQAQCPQYEVQYEEVQHVCTGAGRGSGNKDDV